MFNTQTTVAVTPGSGKNIDGFQTTSAGNIRQSVVIADPSTDANVVPVHATLGAGVNMLGANGTALDTNSGTKSAGTIRVVIATDQPQLSNSLNVNSTPQGTTPVGGDTGNGVSDGGNPMKIGGVAHTQNPSAVTDGQRVNATYDKVGRAVVVHALRDLRIQQQTTLNNTNAETTVVTAISAAYADIHGVIVTNTSATGVNVAFKDSTGGTERFRIYAPANDTRGFMLPSSDGHKQASISNNWTATCSASTSSIYITMFANQNI